MSSTGASQELPEPLLTSPLDALLTQIAQLTIIVTNSTGAFQALQDSSSVSDAALMALAPLASTATSSSSVLTAPTSFSEQNQIIH